MSRPRAVVAGAGGFIGEALVAALMDDGYDVVTVGRTAAVRWDDPAAIAAAVDGSDLLVNLAGKSVDCRYTDRNRDEILRSRVETTRALHAAVAAASAPPRLWLNASTATIYRHAMDRPNTESGGELGQGFSVDVARSWERAFFAGDLPRTRRVALRLAIVVGVLQITGVLAGLASLISSVVYVPLALYAVLVVAVALAPGGGSLRQRLWTLVVLPTMHLAWGVGFLGGVLRGARDTVDASRLGTQNTPLP